MTADRIWFLDKEGEFLKSTEKVKLKYLSNSLNNTPFIAGSAMRASGAEGLHCALLM